MSKLTEDEIKFREQITQRLINLREATGLNQSDFAKAHLIDRQQVNRWESFAANRGVTIYTIKKFCVLINIPLHKFFDDPLFK